MEKKLRKLEDLDVRFNDYEVGPERYVRATWEMHIHRHYVLRDNLSNQFIQKFNQINCSLGISVITINLGEHWEDYRWSKTLNAAIGESDYPVWIWFYGVDALRDSAYAGWLRTRLTVRRIENLRVVFVAETLDDFRAVFCDNREPFYQSTMLLQTD